MSRASAGRRKQGTPRMEPLARLPVFLALAGKRAVVPGNGAGGGVEAELLSARAPRSTSFADHPCEELREVAAQGPYGAIAS